MLVPVCDLKMAAVENMRPVRAAAHRARELFINGFRLPDSESEDDPLISDDEDQHLTPSSSEEEEEQAVEMEIERPAAANVRGRRGRGVARARGARGGRGRRPREPAYQDNSHQPDGAGDG